MHNSVVLLITGFGGLVASTAAYSQEIFEPQEKYKHYTFLGAGAAIGESVFSSDGSEFSVKPYIFHQSDYGFIDGSLANLA